MIVALIVGHSKTSTGAKNSSYGTSEFKFNDQLANEIKGNFYEHNLTDQIVIIHRENGYAKLPQEINSSEADLVVSLHCNAFDTMANGCEMLYYHKSNKGKEVARIFQNNIVQLIENKDRGINPKSSEDRGGYLLNMTKAPCIICEPFFIDNDDELLRAMELLHDGDLVDVYCKSIDESLKYLKEVE